MSWVIDDDSKPAKRKRYNSKMKEGLTSDDIFVAQPDYKKGIKILHHNFFYKGEEEKKNDLTSWESNINEDYKPSKRKGYYSETKEGLPSDDIFVAQPNYKKGKDLLHHKKIVKVKKKNKMIRCQGIVVKIISQPDRTDTIHGKHGKQTTTFFPYFC